VGVWRRASIAAAKYCCISTCERAPRSVAPADRRDGVIRPALEAVDVDARHAKLVGDDEHRQGYGELGEEVAAAARDEAVDQFVADLRDVVVHLLDAR
jgi:hypothetical protein